MIKKLTQQASHRKPSVEMTSGEKLFLLSVVVLALALRLVYHYEMRGNILVDQLQLDERFHDRWARSIAAGDLIGEGVFFRAPLYPYMLGLFYAVAGNSPITVRIMQHLLGAATVILVYILGRSLFGKRAAVVASLLCASYAVIIYFEGRLLFDFLVTFVSLLWLILALSVIEKPSWKMYALIGFLYGLICTMRPPFIALAPVLLGYISWRYVKDSKRIVHCALPLLIAFFIPIVLVMARNAYVGNDFATLASQGGINFYIGNNPLSDGCTPSVPEAGGVAWENPQVKYIAERALGRELRPSEVSSYWYARGWEFICSEPIAAVNLLLKKFYLFWSHIEIPNNHSFYSFERSSAVLTLLPVGFWLVGTLGLAGAILTWRERKAHLPLLFLLCYCLVTIAFFVCDRFRLPIIPLLCIFSGFTVQHIVDSVTRKNWSSLVRGGALVGASALLVNTNILSLRTEVNLGEEEVKALAALESRDLATAADLFGRIASLDPENSGARVNQGIALWGMGRMQEAVEAFHAGIGKDPYFALLNLSNLYYNLNLTDSVRVYAERTIDARPFAPGGYVIAAKNYIVQHKFDEAEEILIQGVAACRGNFVYGEYILAGIYHEKGNLAAADSIYRKVLLETTRSKQAEYMIESEKARFGEDLATLHAKTLHALGRTFAAQQRLDSSEVYFRAAAHLLPFKGDVWADWAVCLLRMNRLEEADTVMQRALRINANNPVVWLNYGTLLARKGDLERARQAVSQALKLKPDFEEANRLMKILRTESSRRQ